MPSAYIVEAVRTAGGRKGGRLRDWHPISLGAVVVDALIDRTGIDGALVDDVIVGCVSQVGAQAGNIGRNIVLSSKLPETVPGTSVDRQCGSSQQAIHFAAQAVMSGVQDVVIAAGVEVMSTVPIGSNVVDGFKNGRGLPMDDKLNDVYGARLKERGQRMFSQFEGAELVAEKYEITREDCDKFAVASHAKAVAAQENGYFKAEIVPVDGKAKGSDTVVVHDTDEGVRPGTSMDTLGKLKDMKSITTKGKMSGRVTAGTSSQICDGSAAMLICNEEGLKKLGLKPKAKIISLALAGTDPVMMLAGPIPASEVALRKANLSIQDMDLYEVNEAFAPVPLSWAKALGADLDKLNVNGGAMALGHPLGATGCKIMTTMLYELERRGGRYGIQAICEGGGTANATIIEMMPKSSL